MSHPYYKHIGTSAMRLVEECSEVIKAVMKIERFGYYYENPQTGKMFIDELEEEIHDVLEAWDDYWDDFCRESENRESVEEEK